MSRIGKNPVTVPDGVEVALEGRHVRASGKQGMLSVTLTDDIEVVREGALLWVKPLNGSKQARQMWGTGRSLIDALVTGVSEGFSKTLEISGVGYRAAMQGTDLVLQVGYSHEVRYSSPPGIQIECPEQTRIVVSGASKQQVGQVAAEIRSYRPPEPYKGKGVRYRGEFILRKEGKKK